MVPAEFGPAAWPPLAPPDAPVPWPLPSAAWTPPLVPDHELLRLIGRGSYGEVWLARNIMGTLRAVKFVARGSFEHDRPFDREYAGLQRFEPISRSHEGLVNILHVGRHEPSRCFYSVMELADDAGGSDGVDGYRPKTLRSELQRRGRLPLEEGLALAFSLANALGHLHQHGLVHRDLKPANIIFVHGQPKIADIGLVAESGDSRSCVGTEGFFPPQGMGTTQADLYALGKVLYETSTGLDRLRFPQLPPEWLDQPGPGTLLEFNEVLVKACETNPARRYQTAAELLADLALLRVGKSVRHLRRLERHLQWARRLGIATLLLTLLAGGGYGLARRQVALERQSRQRVEQAEAEARRQLAEARLSQARALRRTGQAGQRFDCLAVVAAAARAQPSLELRNEAIGALSLVDMRLTDRLPRAGVSRSEPAVDRQQQRYVCGDAQGNLGVRRVADEVELFRLPGEGQSASWVAFSPNGRFLALRFGKDRLTLWDLEQRAKTFELPSQGTEVHARFQSDNRSLIWSAGAQPLRQVDLETGKIRTEWPVSRPVWRFCCSPDLQYLGLAYADTNLVEVLNLEHRTLVARMPQASFVQAIQWHRAKPLLATACQDNRIHVWDPLAGQERMVLEGHQSVPASLDFHPTADLLVSSGWDGTTRLWDLRTGQQRVMLQEAGDNVQFSDDGRWLTLGEYSDAHALVCEVAGDTICRLIEEPATPPEPWFFAVAFDPQSRILAGADRAGVHLMDPEHGVRRGLLEAGRVFSVMFAADGQWLYTAGDAGLLCWPVGWPSPGHGTFEETQPLILSQPACDSVCQVGPALAWTGFGRIYVRHGSRELAQLQAPEQLDHLAASPDGQWLAAAERWHNTVHLWETKHWQHVRALPVPGATRLAFSPDNQYLVIGAPDEFLFWELAGGAIRHRLPRYHTATGNGPLAFSPDGTLLALVRTRTAISLHTYPGLQEVAAFEAPRAAVLTWLTFDPSTTMLAATGTRNQIQVWDLRAMRQHLAALGLDW